jgi:hypothetical protein
MTSSPAEYGVDDLVHPSAAELEVAAAVVDELERAARDREPLREAGDHRAEREADHLRRTEPGARGHRGIRWPRLDAGLGLQTVGRLQQAVRTEDAVAGRVVTADGRAWMRAAQLFLTVINCHP